ncbi:MAG: hypothetical protein CM15mP46_7170 [Alphaproteobacteria bacterium]|nr:MAG: hypothetical protein CM15mP46_7170 [Alphaproteobacteria bacterium]
MVILLRQQFNLAVAVHKSARVIANLGNSTQSGAFSALALAEFNIRHEFPDAVILRQNH